MIDIPQYDPQTPKNVKDIVGNTESWTQLSEQIEANTCPHIVLCGPAGCGKSLFLRIVLEKNNRYPILRIDCTANSGLRDLRDSIRGFARGSRTNKGDFRWIILEHADALTADTQAFLRRMMETTSNTTRIVFECRDAGAIAEPILSRSMLYVVNTPDMSEVRYELMRRTDFAIPKDRIEEVVKLADGNLRKGLIHVLAIRWNSDLYLSEIKMYDTILAKRPTSKESEEWIVWAVEAEKECREQGLDMRNLLSYGWQKNQHVFYVCSQWSRLGGISSRALFFTCMKLLIDA